jgi:hypothetical protein
MLSDLYETWLNGQWVNESNTTYIYDATGNILSESLEIWSNNQWVNSIRTTYTYDANENVLSFLNENWTDGQWVNTSRYTWNYDANEHLLSRLRETWSSGQWVNSNRYSYAYDANGDLIMGSYATWSNSSWRPMDDYFDLQDGAGNSYSYGGYNITLIRTTIETGVAAKTGDVPASYSLLQNYPNPFNPTTTIYYRLPNESHVDLSLYNLLGQKVQTLVNTIEPPGEKTVQIDAYGLPTGVYFYCLDAVSITDPTKHFSQTRKMLLVK